MQLASTLFGVCIIQIKPQLEKLLALPNDSLTKEIRLTQDLMEMFIKYQIPSDLISYDGNPNASVQEKLTRVKTHVKAMQDMIQHSKDTELKEAAMEYTKQALAPQPRSMPMPVPAPSMAYSCCAASCSSSSRSSSMVPQMQAMSSGPPPPPPASIAPPTPAPTPSTPAPTPANPTPTPQDKKEAVVSMDTSEDYTSLPNKLDASFAKMDEDNALRSTIIKAGNVWSKSFQKGLLSKPSSMTMHEKEQKDDKNAAFDLLDALSRSGVLSVDQASLHVVLVATHCFDKTLVETVVQDNVNPIEKVERSVLIMASTIHAVPPATLVQPAELTRVQTYSPTLFLK